MAPVKINLLEAAGQIKEVLEPRIAWEVDDSAIKIAKFGFDFRDGAVELREGDFVVVPRGAEHRRRSLTREPMVLMFEPTTTANAGNAESRFTVTELDRLG
jgi:quercetin dioxygenase-like cupin family protein